MQPLAAVGASAPYSLLSVKDERWQKCWIKSLALLANVLARNEAARAGADEAIFIHEGNVTEGASSNLFVVKGGSLVTHPLGAKILPGVTRDMLLDCARKIGVKVEERAVKLEEATRADEVFVTSATREIMWVSKWDGKAVGGEICGPVTRKLHEEYRSRVKSATT
jgi:D-alanine transaminase